MRTWICHGRMHSRARCGSQLTADRPRCVMLALVGAMGDPRRSARSTARAAGGWRALRSLLPRRATARPATAAGPAAPFTCERAARRSRAATTSGARPRSASRRPTTTCARRSGSARPAPRCPASRLARRGEIDELIAVVKAFAPDAFARPGAAGRARPAAARRIPRAAPSCALSTAAPRATATRPRRRSERRSRCAIAAVRSDAPPLRRPRETDDLDARRRAAALSIATGLAGTRCRAAPARCPRPTCGRSPITSSRSAPACAPRDRSADRSRADRRRSRVADPDRHVAGHRRPDEVARVRRRRSRRRARRRASLAPAQASLHAAAVRALPRQAVSRVAAHRCTRARRRPACVAQIDVRARAAAAASCQRCHAPLAEQQADRRAARRGRHLRRLSRARAGRATGRRASRRRCCRSPGYPLQPLAIYERGDFCMPCHQLPPRTAVDGKPLLDTYRSGSKVRTCGAACSASTATCRTASTRVLGVHDRDTFRQGIALTTTRAPRRRRGHRDRGAAQHRRRPLPADHADAGRVAADRARSTRAARRSPARAPSCGSAATSRTIDGLARARGHADPAGRGADARPAWTGGRTAEATAARVTVEVHPDDYYERFYAERLAADARPGATRALRAGGRPRARFALPRRAT